MARQNKDQFSEEAIKNFTGLYRVLLKVHNRLMGEGYKIKNGKLVPPKKIKQASKDS